jgi:hypothetical protein
VCGCTVVLQYFSLWCLVKNLNFPITDLYVVATESPWTGLPCNPVRTTHFLTSVLLMVAALFSVYNQITHCAVQKLKSAILSLITVKSSDGMLEVQFAFLCSRWLSNLTIFLSICIYICIPLFSRYFISLVLPFFLSFSFLFFILFLMLRLHLNFDRIIIDVLNPS